MAKSNREWQEKGGRSSKHRRLHPDIRRIELLEAALTVLQDQGPINARVEDVTEAAKVAKGTFYIYFSSWDNLLVEVRAHILSKYESEMHKKFATEALSDWWAAFEKECVHFVNFVEELGNLHKAIFHGPIADHPFDGSISAEVIIARLLKTGIDSGVCRNVELDIASRLLFSVLHTTVDGIVQTGDRERYLNSMFDLLQVWLRNPRPNATDQRILFRKGDEAGD